LEDIPVTYVSSRSLVHFHEEAALLFSAVLAHPKLGAELAETKKQGGVLCIGDPDIGPVMTVVLGRMGASKVLGARVLAESLVIRLVVNPSHESSRQSKEKGSEQQEESGSAIRVMPYVLALTWPSEGFSEFFVALLAARLGLMSRSRMSEFLRKHHNPFVMKTSVFFLD
jgi:hypothetical protein